MGHQDAPVGRPTRRLALDSVRAVPWPCRGDGEDKSRFQRGRGGGGRYTDCRGDHMAHTEVAQAQTADGDAPTQVMIDHVFALAYDVFRDDRHIVEWLRTRHPAFGVAPVQLLATRQGIEAVEENLESLSHGIV
jgi:hypothetical protein